MRSTTTILLVLLSLFLNGQTPELTIQLGHSKLIYDVAYSPDGKYVASASADRTVKIWEMEEGREVLTIYIDEGYATSVQFSQDGRELLVGGGSYNKGELKIFDLETSKVVTEFIGHEEYAWNAEFSPDGDKVYSASFDQTVKIWDRSTGEVLHSTGKLPGLMRQLSVDPLGEYVVTTCDDDSVGATLWSAEDLAFIHKLEVDSLFEARSVKFTADGAYIIVGHWDRRVAVFKRGKNTPEYQIDAHTNEYDNIIRCLGTGPKGQFFFTGSSDRLIHQFETSTGEYIGTFYGHADEVYAIDLHPKDGKLISGGSFDKSIKEWDVASTTMLRSFGGSVYPIHDLKLSETGDRLFINAHDRFGGGDVYSWRLDRMNNMVNLGASNENYHFMDLSDKEVMIGSLSGEIRLFDIHTNAPGINYSFWRELHDPKFHPAGENILVGLTDTFSAMGSYASYYSFDPQQKSIEPFTVEKSRLPGDQYLQFSQDGNTYYKLESNWNRANRFSVFSDSTGELINEWMDTTWFLPEYIVCPNDQEVIIFGGNGADLRDVASGKHILEIDTSLKGDIMDVEFIDVNTALFSGGAWSSGYVAVVDLRTGSVINLRDDFSTGQGAVTYDTKRDLIISGGDDARITIMDAKTLKTKLTLFAFADTRGEWAAVHPSGLFDGSKEAIEKYLYFTYRLEPIKLFQLKERYYEPGLVQKVLGYNSEPLRDVGRFNEVSLYPKAHLAIDESHLTIRLQERAGGIGKVSFLINGKERIENMSTWFRSNDGYSDGDPHNTAKIQLTNYSKFMIPGQSNRLEIITTNLERNISSPAYVIDYIPPIPSGFGTQVERPELHALIIGTSDYRGDALDLNFASKDAEDMANALIIGGHQLYGEDYVHIHLMNTDQEDVTLQPTKINIGQKIREIAVEASPDDVLLVYLSGHGLTYGDQDAQFYYLTKEVESGDISDPAVRENYTISTNDMTTWINAIPAQKQIMILDACASGQAVDDLLALSKNVNSSQIKAFDKMKDRTGLFIIAGSAANKVSFEASQFGQSLLTYSLLSGLNVISAKNEDRMVDLVDWINYSKEKVPEYASTIGGIQEPVVSLPRNLNSFDIARISPESMIEVAQIKPVFVRTTLMDMNEMDDVLALSDQIDAYFQDLSSKGRNSDVIFVDVKKFPSAYSIKGFYETVNGMVEVTATLRKGDEKIGLINVSSEAENTQQVIHKIIEELDQLMLE